jgi:hypothetical protein
MRRLLGLASALLAYFAVATLIAEAIMIGYFWSAWHVDRNKLIQALAVTQGVDLLALTAEKTPPREEPPVEQPSYQQIVEARALKLRSLELREQALANALEQLNRDQQTLAAGRKEYERDRQQYKTELAAAQQAAESTGVEQVRTILAKLPPKQAKEALLEMLKKNEMRDAVIVLREMSDGSRAKILKEFKTSEESAKLDSVLRMIRQGSPEADLAQRSREQLSPDRPEKPSPP